jgi:hypothetical protein
LASFYVSDTDWYPIRGILSEMAMLRQLTRLGRLTNSHTDTV